jgi:SMP-30/gluconolaconase/LRE-like protein
VRDLKNVSAFLVLFLFSSAALASDVDEFKIKRELVFEFTQKPVVTIKGDQATIAFTSKAFCDATVAIENADGKIVRHLASGVLGKNAPEPFKKNSLKQVMVWDGKNDQGVYIDDKDAITVRVSLGLKPQFERTLFWSPHKRVGNNSPIIAAAPEGVYVSQGCGVDHVRLFNHDGNYARTIYPFPARALERVRGLTRTTFPQDGQRLPLKHGAKHKSTLLTSGSNMTNKYGCAANAMAVLGKRIALAFHKTTRLNTDGAAGGLAIQGSVPAIPIAYRGKVHSVPPRSAAFSPDGKTLYVTGYRFRPPRSSPAEWLPCVMQLDYASGGKLQVFAGSSNLADARSKTQAFKVPLSVACDAKGRVYVADFMNNRIQVYTPDGKLFKSVPVKHPAHVDVSPKTGELYVFSWMVSNRFVSSAAYKIPATLTRLGPVEDPKVKAVYLLPLNGYNATMSWNRTGGLEFRMAVDFWAKTPTVWVIPGMIHGFGNWGVVEQKSDLRGTGLLLLQEAGGKLIVKRDFNVDVTKAVVRAKPPVIQRQRLYVHPVTGTLYIAEGDSGVMKSFMQLVEIDPATGKTRLVNLPTTAEDMAIGLDGLFYLRDDFMVGRFDPKSWREIPWDYGEVRASWGFDKGERSCKLIAGLPLPSTGRYGWWHLGGMAVSPKGNLVVTCANRTKKQDHRKTGENPYAKKGQAGSVASKYAPMVYPGRQIGWETHVWDKHGKLVQKDVLPGLAVTNGIGIDKDNNLYVTADQLRAYDGKPYFLKHTNTLIKFPLGKGKVTTKGDRSVPVPLDRKAWPERPQDLSGAWVDGAEWFYGGVGFSGWRSGLSCICWNTRPALDLFARSFAPEIDHFSVAVLDTNGNLILRVGQYGNVDDGVPLIAKGGPANPRSVGGDEVVLFHAAYVATHTDRRLFIADAGNARILSVKLDYYATATVALKDVPEGQ